MASHTAVSLPLDKIEQEHKLTVFLQHLHHLTREGRGPEGKGPEGRGGDGTEGKKTRGEGTGEMRTRGEGQ